MVESLNGWMVERNWTELFGHGWTWTDLNINMNMNDRTCLYLNERTGLNSNLTNDLNDLNLNDSNFEQPNNVNLVPVIVWIRLCLRSSFFVLRSAIRSSFYDSFWDSFVLGFDSYVVHVCMYILYCIKTWFEIWDSTWYWFDSTWYCFDCFDSTRYMYCDSTRLDWLTDWLIDWKTETAKEKER